MSFIISTDSCCDIPSNRLKELNVRYVLMPNIKDGQTAYPDYINNEDFEKFYEDITKGSMPKTSLLNVFDMENYLTPILEKEKGDILHIALSSGLSGTYENAVIAGKNLEARFPGRNIFIVDSLGGSLGQGILVDTAITLRAKGHDAHITAEILNDVKFRIQHWVFVDDLKHLKRGGRISGASAVVGSLLKLKPVLSVNRKGYLKVVHKTFGLQKAIKQLADSVEKYGEESITSHGERFPLKVYVAHANCPKNAETLIELIKEKTKCSFHTGYMGITIGTHTGPGALAVFFFGKQKEDF